MEKVVLLVSLIALLLCHAGSQMLTCISASFTVCSFLVSPVKVLGIVATIVLAPFSTIADTTQEPISKCISSKNGH